MKKKTENRTFKRLIYTDVPLLSLWLLKGEKKALQIKQKETQRNAKDKALTVRQP